jgi:tripartite-type tricarboxylate transporter receptor subunit TctC
MANKHAQCNAAIAVVCGCAIAGTALAQQDYPVKPIRLIVGVASGGATDILARSVGARLSENLRQQVIVDSRPGANHILGGEITAKAAPDGYTMQLVPEGFIINPSIYAKLPFDVLRDFTAIAMVALVPNVLVVHPSMPVRTVKQFIALARARPAQMTYGTSGVGAPSHMAAELFQLQTGVKFVHVPYKGSSLAVVDLMGGHIDMSFPTVAAAVTAVRAGKLVAIGVTTTQRASALPEVPTIQEAGVPGYEVSGWYGIIGPAAMPKALVARINQEVNAVLQVPDYKASLAKQGMDARPLSVDEFAAIIPADMKKWAKVVTAAGIKIDR